MNLIILQYTLYFIVGYIMGSHLDTGQFIIMFIVIILLQFVTHIKAIADGMIYNQILNENKDFKKFINKIKRKSKKMER